MEKRAEARTVYVQGIAHAPTLANFLARQTYTVKDAPAGWEQQLKDNQLGDPVVVLPEHFERVLAAGELPLVEVVGNSAKQCAQGAMRGAMEKVGAR